MNEDQIKALAKWISEMALCYISALKQQTETEDANSTGTISLAEKVYIENTSRDDEKILSYHGHSCTLRAVYANPVTFFPSIPELWAGKDSFSGLCIAGKTLEEAATQFKNAIITAETAGKIMAEPVKTEPVKTAKVEDGKNQTSPIERRLSISILYDDDRAKHHFVSYRRHCCEVKCTPPPFPYIGNWSGYDRKSESNIYGATLIEAAMNFKEVVDKYEDERTCSKT